MGGGSKKVSTEPSAIEQAVSRALRDNLEKLRRNTDELHQAIADTVSACASSKATNALPPMLRAQTSAASLAASLDVLTRFVSTALRSPQRSAIEEEFRSAAGPLQEEDASTSAPSAATPQQPARIEHVEASPAAGPASAAPEPVSGEAPPVAPGQRAVDQTAESVVYTSAVQQAGQFDVSHLPQEEQDLHRRANRVAKVSMQDIKMLRPEQVKAGVEHKDICARLRDDIAKAHKEYDRRFRPIMEHPVDYFYHWMVEILADGDPQALGEYPFSSPVRNR